MLKKIIPLFFIIFLWFWSTYAIGALPNTGAKVDIKEENLMQKLMSLLISSNELQQANFSNNVPFQGWFLDWSPIQNLCKVITDPEYLEQFNMLTSKCPKWTKVLYKDIWFNKITGNYVCMVPLDNTKLASFSPKIKIDIQGNCEGGELCSWIEPWYSTDSNNPVNIQIWIKPGSWDVQIWNNTKHVIDPIWLNTIKIYVNNTIVPINLSGDYNDENWNTHYIPLINLNWDWWEKWNFWINYITVRVCDHPIDEETGKLVQSPDEIYKLNCTTKTFVVKLSPSSDKNATSFSNLNQKQVNCSDFWITLPDNAEWQFPVTLDWTFYQSCTTDWNCTPSAETVCNFKCMEGYIKDMDWPNWPGCYPEKQLEDCNDSPVWALKKNEEWKAPNWFSGKQNVDPKTWQFYWFYDLELHKYIPNLNYCQKWCKDGFNLDINGVCQPIQRTVYCKKYFTLDHFEQYNAEDLTDNQAANPNFSIIQYWEDKVNPNTNEMDWLIENNEYNPNEKLLQQNTEDNPCWKTRIPHSIMNIDKWHVTCDTGYVALDVNQDWIIDICKPYDPNTNYVVFPKLEDDIIDNIKQGTLYAYDIQSDTEWCVKIVNNVDYYYNSDKINICVK